MKPTHIRSPRTLADAPLNGAMAAFEGPYTREEPLVSRRALAWAAVVVVALLPLLISLVMR